MFAEGYRTSGGEFVISYAAGYPVGKFEPAAPPVEYADHTDPMHSLDREGANVVRFAAGITDTSFTLTRGAPETADQDALVLDFGAGHSLTLADGLRAAGTQFRFDDGRAWTQAELLDRLHRVLRDHLVHAVAVGVRRAINRVHDPVPVDVAEAGRRIGELIPVVAVGAPSLFGEIQPVEHRDA